jgi:SAM-dependent methyltransferase
MGLGRAVGYSDEELSSVPEGSNLGLGCGNPTALASLEPGETVLDLGSGAGFDCFLAAEKVGPTGRVIGVDMTPSMVERARRNAAESGRGNVEFRLGEIEALPVGDATVDVIISNCVLNLSPERDRVFAEAFRVLRPGGRVMISDLVTDVPVPGVLSQSMDALVGCLPVLRTRYLEEMESAGFTEVRVIAERAYPVGLLEEVPILRGMMRDAATARELRAFASSVRGALIQGEKPEIVSRNPTDLRS